jgi:hypothetical protein
MTANLSWSEFERERPDLAEAGCGLLYQYGEPPGFGDGEFFEFRLGRCLLIRTDRHGDWNPRHTVWTAARVR